MCRYTNFIANGCKSEKEFMAKVTKEAMKHKEYFRLTLKGVKELMVARTYLEDCLKRFEERESFKTIVDVMQADNRFNRAKARFLKKSLILGALVQMNEFEAIHKEVVTNSN